MAFGKKAAPGKAKKGFAYKSRGAETYKERASQQGGNYDSPIKESVKTFNPKAGDHEIRILPPTWEDADHFGYTIFQHFNIGPEGGTYLCLHKMRNEACPICDEKANAEKAGEDELAQALKPGKKILVWVIDRSNEKEGPKLWAMPWTFDRDLCALAVDKKSGEVFELDNPEEGYDISFSIQGEKLTKKYVGIQVARRASPLHDDEDKAQEWLDFIMEHPIPDCLIYKDVEYLENVLGAGPAKEEKPAKKAGTSKKGKDEQDEELRKLEQRGKFGKKKSEPEPEDEETLTWEDIHEMDEDTLLELCSENDLDPDDCPEDVEPADWVCEQFGIEPPEPPEDKKPSFKERMAKLRKGK